MNLFSRCVLFLALLIWAPLSVTQVPNRYDNEVIGSSERPSYTWDEHVYQAIDQRGQGNFAAAAFHFQRAAELKQSDNFQQYWDASIQYARAEMVDDAFELLDKAIEAGMADVKRLRVNTRLEILHEDPRWDQAIEKMTQAEEKLMDSLTHPELRTELMQRWDNDQALVGQWEQQAEVIEENANRLNEILEEVDWPTISMVGEEGSWSAWAIAQHSSDIEFQRLCLARIASVLSRNDLKPELYAELHDRIARNTYQQQYFGMATMARDGIEGFYPIMDEWNVNQRREEIGLASLSVFANVNHIDYQLPSEQEVKDRELIIQAETRTNYTQALNLLESRSIAEAIHYFNIALENYGYLTNLQIFEFAAQLAALKSLDQSVTDKISELVHLLEDRNWDSIGLVVIDNRFETVGSK